MNINDLVDKWLKHNYNLCYSNSINVRIELGQIYENFVIEKFQNEGFHVLKNTFLYESKKLILMFLEEEDINSNVYDLTKEKFIQNGYEIIEFIVNKPNDFSILQSNNLGSKTISLEEFINLSYFNINIQEIGYFMLNNILACNNVLNNIDNYEENYIYNGEKENKIKELKLLKKYYDSHPYNYIDKLRCFIINYLLKNIIGVINIDGIIENNNNLYILELKLKRNCNIDFYINIGEYKRHQQFNNMGFKIEYFFIKVPNVNDTYEYLIQNDSFPKETQLFHYSYNEKDSKDIMNHIEQKGSGQAKDVYIMSSNLFKSCFNLKSVINEKEFLNKNNLKCLNDKIETFINYTLYKEGIITQFSSYLNEQNKLFHYLGYFSILNGEEIFIKQVASNKSKLLTISIEKMQEIQNRNIKYILLIYYDGNKTPFIYGLIPIDEFLNKSYFVPKNLIYNLNKLNNYIDNKNNYNTINIEMCYAAYFKPYRDKNGKILYNFITPCSFDDFFNNKYTSML